MTSLSQKKEKRLLSKRERRIGREYLGEFRSYFMQPHFSFYTTPERKLQQNACEEQPPKEIPGEYFEPDIEVMEIAFSHPQGLTKKCLSNNGIFTFLNKIDKAQA